MSLSAKRQTVRTRTTLRSKVGKTPTLEDEDGYNQVAKTTETTVAEVSMEETEANAKDGTPSSTVSTSPQRKRGRSKKTDNDISENNNKDLPLADEETTTNNTATSPKKKKAKRKVTQKKNSDDEDATDKVITKKLAATSSPPKKTKAAADHQRITERDDLPKLWTDDMAKANGSYTFRIASWNVAGLRALVKKSPTALVDLCNKYNLDMLCLQETKLQEMHLEDPKLKLKGMMEEHGFVEHWSCSTAKKGYSGTAVFVKRRSCIPNGEKENGAKATKQTKIGSFFSPATSTQVPDSNGSMPDLELPINPEQLLPTAVTDKLGETIDNEGRTIILDFPWATVANVYVPNSGQNLERLDFRTKEWDKFFLQYMQTKEKNRGLPIVWLGDLNIAHKASDIWNDGAKHLDKQAGVTPQERASFTEQLEAGYVDAFRHLHPNARGHYSYWSQRAGNREPNKGLRLDYFVCSPQLFDKTNQVIVRDSFMVPDQLGSDHCPVVLELEIKP
ncbi:exodeoxyribonuclease [Nitzschia inconspicua]|uniref:DNA-(apurinic or apyrimidinic site) endonuclease n=1 Tax=Nitzschia inconspicua TaxID=303405 RepID=A0A9K3KLT4_9STRA|nr:exodeoxyribonuclease [Nitzschia inconspicua]